MQRVTFRYFMFQLALTCTLNISLLKFVLKLQKYIREILKSKQLLVIF